MALSEEERRLLDQMEAALAAEDPRLASTLRGSGATRRLRRRRALLAGIGFLAGAAILVAGVQVHWAVSVFGFLVMLAATLVGIAAFEKVGAEQPDQRGPRVASGTSASPTNTAFMDKMEERWRRRQEGDQ